MGAAAAVPVEPVCDARVGLHRQGQRRVCASSCVDAGALQGYYSGGGLRRFVLCESRGLSKRLAGAQRMRAMSC